MQRALADRASTVRVHVHDAGGNLVSADSAPTITITDPDGDTVASGTATQESTGVYTLDFSHGTPDLLEWSADVTVNGVTSTYRGEVEVVGSRVVPLWRLREEIDADRSKTGLGDISDDALVRVAVEVEDWIRAALGFPPFERGERVGFYTLGGKRQSVPGVMRPLKVHSLTLDGTDETANVRIRRGRLERTDGSQWPVSGWVEAHVSHGWTQAPEDIARAARVLAPEVAKTSDLPARASEVATEGAVFTLSMANVNNPTGIPEVDAAIQRHRLTAWI